MPSEDTISIRSLAMNKKVSLSLFSIPVLIALGVKYTEIINIGEVGTLVELLPSDKQFEVDRMVLNGLLVIYSALLFMKQWSHYFEEGRGLGGVFVRTCGCFNDREWFIDHTIAFWHGVIFLAALRFPSYWLLSVGICFIITYLRCLTTIRRKRFATYWRRNGQSAQPQYKHPFSTFPSERIVEAARNSGFSREARPPAAADSNSEDEGNWEQRLGILQESLDWSHATAVRSIGESERPLRVKEILAGWCRVLRVLSILAMVFAIDAAVVLKFAPGTFVDYYIIGAEGGVLMFLFLFDEASIYWGVSRWRQFTD